MSISISNSDIRDTESNLFFIAGVSRSGSTLLQSMLNMHSELVIPPETHFFNYWKQLENQFVQAEDKKVFAQKLIRHWYSNKTRIRDLGLDQNEVQQLADELGIYDPLKLFSLHLSVYRKKRNKSMVGEKTPRHIMHIPDILEAYAGAKFITLFRDPRAAANSEINADFGSPSVTVTTKRWRKYAEMHLKLTTELPAEQYMMLRYSDFIHDVEGSLKRVCDFLEVNFEHDMLNYYDREETGFAPGEESWKKGTLKPIQTDKNEEWKTQLKPWQKVLIEETAGSLLGKVGYDKAEDPIPFPKKLFFQSVDLSRSLWADITKARDEGYVSLVPNN